MKRAAILCTAFIAVASVVAGGADAHKPRPTPAPSSHKQPKPKPKPTPAVTTTKTTEIEKDCGIEGDGDGDNDSDDSIDTPLLDRLTGSPYGDDSAVNKAQEMELALRDQIVAAVETPQLQALDDLVSTVLEGSPYGKDAPVSQSNKEKTASRENRLAVEPQEKEPPAQDEDDEPSNSNSTATATAPTTSADGFHLHALAIGDWGVGGGSCCAKYDRHGEAKYKDEQAQQNIAFLMALSAEKLSPQAIVGHGDNFYWNGLGKSDYLQRFEDTFENVYNQPALQDVEWMNVMGNHDYGGASFLCGESDGAWKPCETLDELDFALDQKFNLQSNYKSHTNDRWQMPSHYYKKTLLDKKSGLSVDFFNVDTNAATNHGAQQVCCQCYGYLEGKTKDDPDFFECGNAHRGHKMCFGGNTEFFDACMAKFKNWTDDSLLQLEKDTLQSQATWKIVNSHFSPHYHMDEKMMEAWNQVLEKGKVQLFLNGHTHAEGIDFGAFNVHFVTNGAGGGIQSESLGEVPPHIKNVQKVWRAPKDPYGFVEMLFSKEFLKIQFITFDDNWKFAKTSKKTMKGKGQVLYCYLIPHDGSMGKPCEEEAQS